MRTEAIGSKIEQCRGIMATVVTASSLAKETGGFSTTSTDRAYSNGRSVMRRECGQTWTRVRVKYYNY